MGDSPAPGAPLAARIVGRYAIYDEVASGGMATVYLGRLMGAGGFARTVAIKRLHPQFARDPEFVAMFLEEARLAARIRHPNVVPTLDVVASKGELFLVMEYVQGESLSRLARALSGRGERIPIPVLLRVMSDVLQGLHAAHEACDERGASLEIVHRDVTPQNVLVGVDGVGRLLDFGVAKAAGRAHTTKDGQIKGKLAYMAPEQLTGAGVTRQTDVYAAAVVLWELLSGQRLFAGGSEVDVIARLLRRDVKPPSAFAPGIPAALDEVVMRGLSADPASRHASARALCLALGACGVPEAATITVGVFVEGLASTALAERTAKIAAIELHPDPGRDAIGTRPSTSSRPPAAPGTSRNSIPTMAAIPAAALQSGPLHIATTVTMNSPLPGAPSSARRRLALGAAAAGLAVAALLAMSRGPRRTSDASTAATSGGTTASEVPVAVAAPDPPPAAAADTAAPPSAFPVEPAPPPDRHAVPAVASKVAVSRGAHPAPTPPKAALPRSVMDTRE